MSIETPVANYKVEHGVPIPDRSYQISKWEKLLSEMKPGDSVLFESKKFADRFYQYLKKKNKQAIVRRVNETGAMRVWLKG